MDSVATCENDLHRKQQSLELGTNGVSMNTAHRAKPGLFPQGIALSFAILGLMLGSVPATTVHAYTTLSITNQTENAIVTEGHPGDIDQLRLDAEMAPSRLPREGHFIHHHHPDYHHDDDEVMIVSVGSSVYSDTDRDGFFTHFSITVDADVDYGSREVQMRIFLRSDGDEYTEFYTSNRFHIYDNLSSDSYSIDSKLVNNYPAGFYDVRIDVIDAFSGERLDSVDAETHSTLFAMPLESAMLDDGPADAIVHENIGSAGIPAILVLLSSLVINLALRRRQRQI